VSVTFKAGWIAIIIVKGTDKKIKGFVVPPKR